MREINGRLRICLDLMEKKWQTPKYRNTLSLRMGKNWVPVVWGWRPDSSHLSAEALQLEGLRQVTEQKGVGWAFGERKAVRESAVVERKERCFVTLNVFIAVAGRASSLNSSPCRKKDTGTS